MTDAQFLNAVMDNPDDDEVRLVYADWLDERGDPRGEFIRVQFDLERVREDDRGWAPLKERERRLLLDHRLIWSLPLRGLADAWSFHRGFIEEIDLSIHHFLMRADDLFQAAPIRRVTLRGYRFDFSRLLDCPYLPRLRFLALPQCFLAEADASALRSASALVGLSSLDLSRNHMGDAGAEAVARSPFLSGLVVLNLQGYSDADYQARIRAGGARLLALSPHLRRLQTLMLADNVIGDAGLSAIALSPEMAQLTELDVSNNDIGAIGDAGIEALVTSTRLVQLKTLKLAHNPLGLAGANALATWPGLLQLRTLDLRGCSIPKASKRALSESPYRGASLRLLL